MNCKTVGTFCRIIILLSVVSNMTALYSDGAQSDPSTDASMRTNIYDPSYITPLVEQCILFDIKALFTSTMQLTPSQKAVIRCYYSYCKNIINMAKLVTMLPPNPAANGSAGTTNATPSPLPPCTAPDLMVDLSTKAGSPSTSSPNIPDPSATVASPPPPSAS